MLFSIVLVFSIALVAFALLFRILLRRTRAGVCDPLEWLDDFSAADYRPMERLLDARDGAFLASQTGFQPSIARRLRRQRIGIFQSYLRGMIRDFHRLLRIARFITVYASQDSASFEADLWSLRWRFYRCLMAAEARLALSVMGLGAVDARGLLTSLERMQFYTQSLIPAVEPAA
jgi:hypothetical protein